MKAIKSERLLKKIGKILLTIVSWPYHWIVKLLSREYHITIWYDPAKKSTYEFKSIETCEPKHLKGKLVTGEKFELKVQEPFNYQIRQVK